MKHKSLLELAREARDNDPQRPAPKTPKPAARPAQTYRKPRRNETPEQERERLVQEHMAWLIARHIVKFGYDPTNR